MSLAPIDVVNFLERSGVLEEADDSPWPDLSPEDQPLPVDWGGLFPGRRPRGTETGYDFFDDPWLPEFDDDFLGDLDRALGEGPPGADRARDAGPDVCAWYRPFHFHGLGWGIYIREDCMLRLAVDIGRFLPAVPHVHLSLVAMGLVRAAFATFFLHEAYHHKTESFAIRLQVVERKGRYVPYARDVYRPLLAAGSDDLHEEALANADSYNRLTTNPYKNWVPPDVITSAQDYLRWRFPLDPPGYRKAVDYLGADAFRRDEYVLRSEVQEGTSAPFRSTGDWQVATHLHRSLFNCRSDIWTVIRPGTRSILPASVAYPSISTTKMIKLLREFDYERTSGGKGSHIKLTAAEGPPIVLPGTRKDLTPGVVRSVAKALGYRTVNDFRRDVGL